MPEQTHKDKFKIYARRLLEGRQPPLAILEVGGGTEPHIELEESRYTVLDICEASTARSRYAHETIVADVEHFQFAPNSFDAVVFWNVLEHVADPKAALLRTAAALKPQGIIVIAGPILNSFKALLTRLTPYRLHVEYYRRVLGRTTAGTGGESPFPVEHSPLASPEEICRILRQLQFNQIYFDLFPGIHIDLLKERWPWMHRLYNVLAQATSLLSRGRYSAHATEFILVMKGP